MLLGVCLSAVLGSTTALAEAGANAATPAAEAPSSSPQAAAASPSTVVPEPGTSATPATPAEAPASPNVAAPDPLAWLARLRQKPLRGAYLGRIAIVGATEANKAWPFIDVKPEVFGQDSFLDVVKARDASWSLLVNRERVEHGEQEGGKIRAVMLGAAVDAVLRAQPNGAWELVRADNIGTLQVLGHSTPSRGDDRSIAGALRQILGYDGLVLAQEGDLVLARTADLRASQAAFAAAITDSAASYVVDEATQHGQALLSLVRSSGSLSIFRLVSAKSTEPLPFATKLMIDSSGQGGTSALSVPPLPPHPSAGAAPSR